MKMKKMKKPINMKEVTMDKKDKEKGQVIRKKKE